MRFPKNESFSCLKKIFKSGEVSVFQYQDQIMQQQFGVAQNNHDKDQNNEMCAL